MHAHNPSNDVRPHAYMEIHDTKKEYGEPKLVRTEDGAFRKY